MTARGGWDQPKLSQPAWIARAMRTPPGETYEFDCSSCINRTPDFGATNSAFLKILKKDIPIKMCPPGATITDPALVSLPRVT